MKLIVGLGNPGEKYKNNRHNVGFILVDEFVSKNGKSFNHSTKKNSLITQVNDLHICKPQNYMNNSGDSVLKMSKFYKISPENIYIIHDDLDLEFGVVKVQFGRGSAGHNGVQDIMNKLGTKDFWRIRVGIGRPTDNTPTEDFVLKDLSNEQIVWLRELDLNEYILVEEPSR